MNRKHVIEFIFVLIVGLVAVWFGFWGYQICNALPGDLDSIANLSAVFQTRVQLESFFHGTERAYINYPSSTKLPIFSLGGYPGLLILCTLFSYLFDNPLVVIWGSVFFIMILNGISFYYLIKKLTGNKVASLISSVLINFNLLYFSHIDNINIITFVFVFLFLISLIKYREFRNSFSLSTALISLAVSFYFNPYVSLVVTLFALPYLLRESALRIFSGRLLNIFIPLLLFVPYLMIIFYVKFSGSKYNYVAELTNKSIISLDLSDFLSSLNGAPFGVHRTIFDNPFFSNIRSSFPGLGFLLMFLLSLGTVTFRLSRFWIGSFVILLILSLGPVVYYKGEALFESPVFLLFDCLGFSTYFRIPARFSILFMIPMVIVSALGIARAYKNSHKLFSLYIILFILNMWEIKSVEFHHKNSDLLTVSEYRWIKQLRDYPKGSKLILHYPSSLFSFSGDRNEYLYTYYQSLHGQNIVNGWESFYSDGRMKTNELLSSVRSWSDLKFAADQLGADFVCIKTDSLIQVFSEQELYAKGVPFELVSLDSHFLLFKN